MAAEAGGDGADRGATVQEYVLDHVMENPSTYHIPFTHESIPIPEPFKLHGAMVILCSVFLIIIFCVLYKKNAKVPTGLTNLLEVFVVFIRDEICIQNMGEEDGRKLTPIFCTLFFFILGMNLMGMIPLFSAATGNINVTGALACVTLFFMIFGAMYKNGILGFFKAFVPAGVPWPVLFMVTPLEILGVFIKCFALMIRLFANMLAGHTALLSLLGLIVTFGYLVSVPVMILALGISLLETFVAFLQAYVFILLSSLFIGMMYHPSH